MTQNDNRILANLPLARLLRVESRRLSSTLLNPDRNGVGRPIASQFAETQFAKKEEGENVSLFLYVRDPYFRSRSLATSLKLPRESSRLLVQKLTQHRDLWAALIADLEAICHKPVQGKPRPIAATILDDVHDQQVRAKLLHMAGNDFVDVDFEDLAFAQRFPDTEKPLIHPSREKALTVIEWILFEHWRNPQNTDFLPRVDEILAKAPQHGIVENYREELKSRNPREIVLQQDGRILGELFIDVESSKKLKSELESKLFLDAIQSHLDGFRDTLILFHLVRGASCLAPLSGNRARWRFERSIERAMRCVFGRPRDEDHCIMNKLAIDHNSYDIGVASPMDTDMYVGNYDAASLNDAMELTSQQLGLLAPQIMQGPRPLLDIVNEEIGRWANVGVIDNSGDDSNYIQPYLCICVWLLGYLRSKPANVFDAGVVRIGVGRPPKPGSGVEWLETYLSVIVDGDQKLATLTAKTKPSGQMVASKEAFSFYFKIKGQFISRSSDQTLSLGPNAWRKKPELLSSLVGAVKSRLGLILRIDPNRGNVFEIGRESPNEPWRSTENINWDDCVDDWDRSEVVAQYVNKAFVSFTDVLDHLSIDRKSARILDYGCGTGRFSELLANLGSRVVGMDKSKAMVDRLRVRIHRANLTGVIPVHGDIADRQSQEVPELADPFDIIVGSQVFPYVDDYQETLEHLVSLLRPGGHLIQLDWEHTMTRRRVIGAFESAGLKLSGFDSAFEFFGNGDLYSVIVCVGCKQDQ